MAATEPIRNRKHVNKLMEYFLSRGEIRNHVLVAIGIHTALRISDILRLTWDDVYDFENKRVLSAITVFEKKTGKGKIIALHKIVIKALGIHAASAKPGMPVIINNNTHKPISRIQAYRIIRSAAENLRIQIRVSCHSLRKTFGYHAWKGGVSPAVIMEIYNHSSLAVTRCYLGVTQDDKNKVYLGLNFGG